MSRTPTDQSQRDEIFTRFEERLKMNQTMKDTESKIQIKPGHIPIKQKARPIPYNLQRYVEKEINKNIKSVHLEKVQKVDEDGFVSAVVFNVRKDKSVKIALGSKELNDSCTKMRSYMPNMVELLNQICTETTRAPSESLWISELDFEYADGQFKLSEETSKHCNFAITGRNTSGYYRFKKGLHGLSDIPTKIQEKVIRTLNY